ncbi:hypothetical protein LWI29_024184 [Acer saccharum]|uniref:Uncharacterized protein n=1 Tax=Acer saccharum TaxID=4024 RepID=A0AA39W292_ACESA|nr:hypothetical protein LWI29_024184 [Acer saccharum]
MISSRRLIKLARKQQKRAAMKHRRISFTENNSDHGQNLSISVANKGHFVVYTTDEASDLVMVQEREKELKQDNFIDGDNCEVVDGTGDNYEDFDGSHKTPATRRTDFSQDLRRPMEKMSPSQCKSIVTWAMPQLTDRSKLPNIVDPVIRDTMDLKQLYQVAAVAVLCVQPEPSYRPLITVVLHSLIPLVPIELGVSLRVA